MKRLTWRVNGEARIMLNGVEICGTIADRLAAYEETGLEPEEIAKIREDVENGYMKSTARRYGISVDRLSELAQADREGLCVILPKEEPLKKGMTIWYVDTDTGEIEEGEVFSTDYKDGRLDSFSVDFKFSGDFDAFFGSAWGSCFFGSREQAEAALRREQDGQDD